MAYFRPDKKDRPNKGLVSKRTFIKGTPWHIKLLCTIGIHKRIDMGNVYWYCKYCGRIEHDGICVQRWWWENEPENQEQ